MQKTLNLYQGSWTNQEAAHLLRRTLFGATINQINDAVDKGMVQTVSDLFTLYSIDPPINYQNFDLNVSVGETWANKPLPSIDRIKVSQSRYRSLRAWLMERTIMHDHFSIVEKMSLFWHNHFACDYVSSDSQGGYDYLMLLRDNSLGNFKQLVKDITVTPLMLKFLNGNLNSKNHPNENYARELFELYTIGKGQQVGDGDYTNYTEEDILQAAKILTGWRYKNFAVTSLPLISTYFTDSRHDNSDKILSKRFSNKVIFGNKESEYEDLIDIIFQEHEVARFICRKLYRWFVNTEVNNTINSTVIEEMAQTLVNNNYEITPVLKQLFLSEHFYESNNRGTIIKNPIELMANLFKTTNTKLIDLNFSIEDNYSILYTINKRLKTAGMGYFRPPSVAGWTAYYLEPSYSELWINSALLLNRFNMSDKVTLDIGYSDPNIDSSFKIDILGFLNYLAKNYDVSKAEVLIDQLEVMFSCKPFAKSQRTELKKTLTDGLPDFEWAVEYNDYLAHSNDFMYSDPIEERIKLVLAQLFHMPEFQIQ